MNRHTAITQPAGSIWCDDVAVVAPLRWFVQGRPAQPGEAGARPHCGRCQDPVAP